MNNRPTFNHFCFDLDGTLVDSNKTIYNSTLYTLDRLGIEYNIDEKEFELKIGKHFVDIFKHFNVVVSDFEEFITIYKANYFEQIHHSHVYSGVEQTLIELKSRGYRITLLTTKVQDQAERIIEHFNLRKYFDLIMGRRNGIEHKPSPEPLLKICNELKIDVKSTLMVGDTELDIQCGKNAGSFTCGVLYGYRTRELMELENPDFIISTLPEILTLINN